jgi:hypothetical protein
MRLRARKLRHPRLPRLRRKLAQEDGFTALAAIAVLMISSLLVSAAFVAAQSDIHSTQYDLNQKLAYQAARGGINEFLHHLNQDPNYWAKCPTQPVGPLPGSTTQQYSYQPVPANGSPACLTAAPIDTMIDVGTGTFRMQFSGYAGGSPQASRSIVASFRRDSPLDFLWYTIYETLDPNVYPDPAFATDNCQKFHRDGRQTITHRDPITGNDDNYCGNIDWITGDVINGPMYTQDSYSICGAPVFGRDSNDKIESLDTQHDYADCGSPPGDNVDIKGTSVSAPDTKFIGLPTYNTQLRQDALDGAGTVFSGPTVVNLNGSTARIWNNGVWLAPIPLSSLPIIYVDNSIAGCSSAYSPYNVTYDLSGGCGNVYVYGNYSAGVTIAAANDIIIGDPIPPYSGNHKNVLFHTNNASMLGLVANNFVRVMHGRTGRDPSDRSDCGSFDSGHTIDTPTRIDAAILALNHSFIVDNYDCGSPLGTLEVNGAIAQKFRGTVGTHSGSTVRSGYIKDYTYDDRLHSQEPPYLFDIQNASWHIERETLCVPGSSDPSNAC